jgi:hypothetical protein
MRRNKDKIREAQNMFKHSIESARPQPAVLNLYKDPLLIALQFIICTKT